MLPHLCLRLRRRIEAALQVRFLCAQFLQPGDQGRQTRVGLIGACFCLLELCGFRGVSRIRRDEFVDPRSRFSESPLRITQLIGDPLVLRA